MATVVLLDLGFLPYLIAVLDHSYSLLPLGSATDTKEVVGNLSLALSSGMDMCLQAGAPIALCYLVINLALGVVGRSVPQLHTYFTASPIVLASGLFLLWKGIADAVEGVILLMARLP